MKVHLSLETHDLSASVSFYRALLDAEPAKQYDDYALFLTEHPGLELALEPSAQAIVSDDHFGIAVDEPTAVERAIERFRNAGLSVDIERGETCCYAVQDKVWATDPDGRRWETYYVISESDTRIGDDATCCREADGTAACCHD